MTDFHFVMIGTVKAESKEVALDILKTIMNKREEIKDKVNFTFLEKLFR